jgi:hypothetical protein
MTSLKSRRGWNSDTPYETEMISQIRVSSLYSTCDRVNRVVCSPVRLTTLFPYALSLKLHFTNFVLPFASDFIYFKSIIYVRYNLIFALYAKSSFMQSYLKNKNYALRSLSSKHFNSTDICLTYSFHKHRTMFFSYTFPSSVSISISPLRQLSYPNSLISCRTNKILFWTSATLDFCAFYSRFWRRM